MKRIERIIKKFYIGLAVPVLAGLLIGAVNANTIIASANEEPELFLPVNDIDTPTAVYVDDAEIENNMLEINEMYGDNMHLIEEYAILNDAEVEYWRKFSNKILYNQLSDAEKNWWDQTEAACYHILVGDEDATSTPSIRISDGTPTDADYAKLFGMFKYSNPQFYFLWSGYSWSSNSMSLSVSSDFRNGLNRRVATNALKAKIDTFLSAIDTTKMDEEIERQIHEKLVGETVYKSNEHDQNVYSTLVLNETVCAGYTQAMTLLCNGVGIDTVGVTGDADGSGGWGRHAWNMIKLHGIWYLVDATWDDQSSVYYKYYDKSHNSFYKDHHVDAIFSSFVDNAQYDAHTMSWTAPTIYFNNGNYTYFSVNANSSLDGGLLAKAVAAKSGFGISGAPRTVLRDGELYNVINGSGVCTHDYETVITLAPTCTKAGTQKLICKKCGDEKEMPVSAIGHNWDGGKITTAMTCKNDGVRTITCINCRSTKTETIERDPNNHNWDGGTIKKSATCDVDGIKEYKCRTCGKTKQDIIKSPGHNYYLWYSTMSTCVVAGHEVYYCMRCGETKEVEMEKAAHTWVYATDVAPTCISKGCSGGIVCSYCNEVKEPSKEVDKIDHNYVLTMSQKATCMYEGYDRYDCLMCGASKMDTYPKVDHVWVDYYYVVYPTTEYCGRKVQNCNMCFSTREIYLDPLPDEGLKNTMYAWKMVDGISYWYESGIRQGTYDDKQGVIGDGTVRGREIYDSVSDGWYWLDACYDGAKACNKEVWMPYIYQDEKKWDAAEIEMNSKNSGDMAKQVIKAIADGSGKWVRYDANGKMIKGWYTVAWGTYDAVLYPSQVGNTYYYDYQTGLMAKGWVTIDGVRYHFDEVTGALR